MANHFFLIKEYINYVLKAKSAHGIHSPFVFDFIKNVLNDDRHFYAFDDIQQLRNQLYADTTILNVEDFGAGSLLTNFKQRKINDIARTAGRNEKFGKLLFRIINRYNYKNIIELGTSLGIGTSYMASANALANIVTLEGSKEIAVTASRNFDQMKFPNIKQVIGNFDDTLIDVLNEMKSVDLLFIDGNHRKEPTFDYFQKALPYTHNDSMMIFDDIHWSQGMREAWDTIRNHHTVSLSIDLFYFGIVLFKKEFKEKQHFVLKY
jgi:predicted O-methyltransferase YrrM